MTSEELDLDTELTSEMISRAENEGVEVADSYQITTVVPYSDKEPEVETYTLPVEDLDDFFYGYTKTNGNTRRRVPRRIEVPLRCFQRRTEIGIVAGNDLDAHDG